MEPHVERMLMEQKELQEKVSKLEVFINENPIFDRLSYDEQVDMRTQLSAMQTYLIVLTHRIERATELTGESRNEQSE